MLGTQTSTVARQPNHTDRATIRFIPPLLIFVSHAITVPLVVLPAYRLFQFLSVFSSHVASLLACFFSWYACTTQHWTKDRLWASKPFQDCSLTKLSNGVCPLHCAWRRLVFQMGVFLFCFSTFWRCLHKSLYSDYLALYLSIYSTPSYLSTVNSWSSHRKQQAPIKNAILTQKSRKSASKIN